MQQNHPNSNPPGGVTSRLAESGLGADTSGVRFACEDGGRSLAEVARRDLDAALQLLADRAQYITGATGAAIALRRDGRNDMLCRASTGSNAPELGALLSTEFGLSGESVRTKQFLRCDDAERDARVNREVCRRLGIASVVVMPVVNDDEVLGVFELFSGRANAFGDRDVSAVQRLSEMVETAVRLAHATETLPDKLKTESATTEVGSPVEQSVQDDPSEQILDEEIFAEPVVQKPVLQAPSQAMPGAPAVPGVDSAAREILAAPAVKEPALTISPTAPVEAEPAPAPLTPAPAKKLFWSAATSAGTDAEKPVEADQSHIPPVLRALRKCEVCGFPITAGRVLCVECEEKKWRGQLKRPSPGDRSVSVKDAVPAAKPAGQAFAAHAAAKMSSVVPTPSASVAITAKVEPVGAETQKKVALAEMPGAEPANPAVREVEVSRPVVFSAGLESSQSWFSANKYIIGVLVIVAAVVAAFFLFR